MTFAPVVTVLFVGLMVVPADAKSSLQLEVREPKKARLVSADVFVRTLAGKMVRKLYAAAGRVKLDNAPVGTFNLEARTRSGNLVGRSRVVVKPNAFARVVIAVRPAPPARASARPIKTGAVRLPSKAGKPTGTTRPPVRKSRGRGRAPANTGRGGSKPKGVKPIKVGVVLPPSRDWGKGKVRVCRGDVFDGKGRRVSGKIQVFSGTKPIGHVNVVSGYFSLYDLANGTYQLRFSTTDNKKKANSNVSVVKGKLGKVVVKVP